ncbi:MAG: hypothetical protein NT008_08105 [Methylococcales bacterium]|nr:hypothetical protein [Methylococcales bacterium]
MKKNNLSKGAFVVLLLANAVVSADQKYPAADFQPEVLYQDNAYIAKNSQSSTVAAKPAETKKVDTSSTKNQVVDSKYPAADFQPEVLYQDKNYKQTAAPVAKEVISKAIANDETSTVAASESKDDSSQLTYVLGLAVLAAAGMFLKKRSAVMLQKSSYIADSAVKKSYALNTGVAKYLNKVTGTGVSRYVESHVRAVSVSTGVAKYMAKQSSAPKVTANNAATGVEKYMRDRG